MEETRCRNPSKIYPPNHPNPIKITQKSLTNPPKMPPKPLQNGSESLPIMKKDRLQPPKQEKRQNYSDPLRRFGHFWGPNGPQIWWKSEEKSMEHKNMFFRIIVSWFGPRFGGVFSRYFERKSAPFQKMWKIEKPYKTLAIPAKIKGRLLEQASKIIPKSMKNCMFVGMSILDAFWKDFGRILEGQNLSFSFFFRHFFEANFGKRFGRQEN